MGRIDFRGAASIASFQQGELESRVTWMSPDASVRTWMPAIHAGMTKSPFSFSLGERKLMKHFGLKRVVFYFVEEYRMD
jgi:hypothetical protein